MSWAKSLAARAACWLIQGLDIALDTPKLIKIALEGSDYPRLGGRKCKRRRYPPASAAFCLAFILWLFFWLLS